MTWDPAAGGKRLEEDVSDWCYLEKRQPAGEITLGHQGLERGRRMWDRNEQYRAMTCLMRSQPY